MPDVSRLPLTSADPDAARRDQLQALFPEAFPDGVLDLARLQTALGGQTNAPDERYGLTWAGKRDAIRAAQTVSTGTLRPVREDSINWDATENVIIEGDNLETLKLLQTAYHRRVKMIYIDPPYNTGNDFLYPDDFRAGLQTYLRFSGQTDENGVKMVANREENGRFHSDWLSMMLPRLHLAKNLLRDDGVIFISIDDNEVANLRLLINEVFGEENFLGPFVWKRRTGSNDAKDNISVDHEYIVIARRSADYQFGGIAKDFANYKNPDNDPRGAWAPDNLTCNKTAEQRPNLYYPITNPKTGIEYQCNPNRVWAYKKDRMQEIISQNKVIWPSDKTGTPQYKRHQSEVKSQHKPISTWIEASTRSKKDIEEESDGEGVTILQTGLNQQGTKEFRALFETQVFDYPKPVTLIKNLIRQATDPNSAEGDIVVDFFAGSGTTGQAMLELNKEDGGNRKFVLIQLNEPTPESSTAKSAGYNNIAEITRERVRRVIKKLDADGNANGEDRGFRAYKLDSSCFKLWDGEHAGKDADTLAEQLALFVENRKPERTEDDVFCELLLKSGFPLTAKTTEFTIGGQKVTVVGEDELALCLSDPITEETLAAMRERKPGRVLVLDSAFAGNDALKTNAALQMQDAGIQFQTV